MATSFDPGAGRSQLDKAVFRMRLFLPQCYNLIIYAEVHSVKQLAKFGRPVPRGKRQQFVNPT